VTKGKMEEGRRAKDIWEAEVKWLGSKQASKQANKRTSKEVRH